jgi:hypothetical protein
LKRKYTGIMTKHFAFTNKPTNWELIRPKTTPPSSPTQHHHLPTAQTLPNSKKER